MRYPLVLVICLALMCTGCGKKKDALPDELVRPVKAITLAGAASGSIRVYPGKVDASDTAMLAFQDSGKLIELPVVPGQRVKKGEVLAKIDPRDFEQVFAAAKAKYIEAQTNADRFKTLYDKEVISMAEMQAKVKDSDVLKAQMDKAAKSLQDTVLIAPFDGMVSQRLVENFQNVKAGEVAIRVQQVDKLKVLIYLPESDIAGAQRGSRENIKAVAVFSSIGGREFPLTLNEWETEADPATQTFLLKFLMDQPSDANILPGMTAQVRLELPSGTPQEKVSSFFAVPSQAVFPDERGTACVWIIDPKLLTVHKREVVLGQVIGTEEVQVTKGLAAGETVATTGVRQLREGMKVRILTGKIGE